MEKPHIYVYLIGGFTDNIKIYNIKYTELGNKFKITFVVKSNYRSPTRSNNLGLKSNYNLPDIITESELPRGIVPATFLPQHIEEIKPNLIYCYQQKQTKSKLFITNTIMNDNIQRILKAPSVRYSDYTLNLCKYIKKGPWVLLGNRCSYLQKAYNGKDKLERMLQMADFLIEHPIIDHLLIALDDDEYISAFRYIFGDILKNRKFIYLRLQNDHEHEYIKIAQYCTPLTTFVKPERYRKFRNFIHDHSGFYSLLESFIGIAK